VQDAPEHCLAESKNRRDECSKHTTHDHGHEHGLSLRVAFIGRDHGS